jgi:hypothetical protein
VARSSRGIDLVLIEDELNGGFEQAESELRQIVSGPVLKRSEVVKLRSEES